MALGLLAASGGLLYYYMNRDNRDRNLSELSARRRLCNSEHQRRSTRTRGMPVTCTAGRTYTAGNRNAAGDHSKALALMAALWKCAPLLPTMV